MPRELVAILIIALGVFISAVTTLECTSQIYCQGPLLNAIQMSGIFNDSKTYVDMPLRYPPEVVLARFAALPSPPSKAVLEKFLFENYYLPRADLAFYLPEDWQIAPPFLQNFRSNELKDFATALNFRWLNLSRTFNYSLSCPDCYSALNVSYPFIVAGGRFREFYYWDSFWIIEGLMVSGMYKTTWQMLQNLLGLVDEYGFVPNGGRIYYLDRSQPPLLTQMVHRYFQTTHNVTFLKQALRLLDKEYDFWQSKHSVNVTSGGANYTLSKYDSHNRLPRPEAYVNDVELAESANLNGTEAEELFSQIATACESGWDFSSRWMNSSQNLSSTLTKDLVPVDLNSILYANEHVLSGFHQLLNNPDKAEFYKQQAYQRAKGIYNVLWDEEDNIWYDYDWKRGKFHKTGQFYPSALTPLWAQAYLAEDGFNSSKLASIILSDRVQKPLTEYSGGVPTSLINSGEQWDFPNAWPPLMYFMIEGINNVIAAGSDKTIALEKLSGQIIYDWIRTNFCGWNSTKGGDMFEKYDVEEIGSAGYGGQYKVQTGFGWTNGVALYLLENFGAELFVESC